MSFGELVNYTEATPFSAAAGTNQPPGASNPFGQPANPSQPTTSLFGNTSNPPAGTAAPTGSLFGNTRGAQPPAGGAFGSGGGNASTPPTGSLFGNTANNTTSNISAPAVSSPFSFGQQNNTQSNTSAPPLNPTQPFSFGGSGGAATPASGSTTPASKPLFGGFGQSTTPAAPQPSSTGTNLFGAKPAGTSLFGGNDTSTPTANTTTPTASLFGAKPAENAPAPSGALFAAQPAATGANPAPATPAAPTLFSTSASNTGTTTPAAAPPASRSLFSFGAKPGAQSGSESDTSMVTATTRFSGGQVAPTSADANKPAAPAGTSAPSSGSLFGGNLFGQKPAETPEEAPKPSAASAPPSGGFSFGNFGAAKTDKPATPPKPPAGGFSFGTLGNTSTPAAAADKVATPALTEPPKAPAGGFSFGNLGGAKTDKPATPAEPPKATTGLGFPIDGLGGNAAGNSGSSNLFGAKPAEALSSTVSPTTNLFGGTSKTATSAPAAVTAGNTSTAGPSEPAPNLLRGKTLEDIVDGWNKDLDTQMKEFERQAGEVREWDKMLVRNGNQVNRLCIIGFTMLIDVRRSLHYIDRSWTLSRTKLRWIRRSTTSKHNKNSSTR